MLKKRLSKGSDTNGETAPQIISPIPSTTDAQDNADNVVFVVATDDIQPTQDIEPAESVLSHNSDDATGDSRITPSNEHVTTVVELPAVAAVTFVAGISNPEPNGHPVTQRKSEDTPVPGMPTNDASEVCDPIHATSVDTPTQSPSDAPLPEADTVAFAPAPETPIQHSDGAEVVGSRPPPPPRRPSIHRHLDRRSSRILEGLTRKVQHVRQTTSMVLRRSVGSHMSFRPATPPDIFQGSVVGLAGLRGCGLNDVELEPEHMPPQYSVSYEEPGGTRTETNNADDCTSVLGTGGEDNPTFVEDVLRASSHINDVNGKPVDVSTARSSTALNATSDKFHASNHMDTFSRKLSSVRHGTNVAVRNSVTRVKNIFVPKRSVAA
ncbi:hypothetical protein FBU31_004640 [Coemansia sp. 'formosensis']|nr:hypothetical protein FBU31_004640 [Coemansia sp. 'formosensis']